MPKNPSRNSKRGGTRGSGKSVADEAFNSNLADESIYHRADPTTGQRLSRAILIDVTEPEQAQQALAKSQDAMRETCERLRQTNEELECRVAERTAQLRALAVELVRVEERDRQRVADALHEGLLQLLTGALMNLAPLKAHPGIDAARIANVERCLNEAIGAGRTLTQQLCPPTLRTLGLLSAVEWLTQRLHQHYGLTVELATPHAIDIDEEEVRITLFRAAHELLLNVVKHAHVSRARLQLRRLPSGPVRMVISEEGVGFDPDFVRAGEGVHGRFGLFSIRERVESLGGRFEVQSAPGRGSRITILMPITRPEPSTPEVP